MRIAVDRRRCEGHGLCEGQAPEVFTLDDEGEVQSPFFEADLPGELTGPADRGVSACPVAALSLVG
ncbi:ferredoxin [Modestobacter lapidis]|nr:ferredoxin [Modestobacter lapidis]